MRLELAIRLAKETSWDVAWVRNEVVRLNRELAVPLETVVVMLDLRVQVRLEEPSARRTISGVCW